MSRAYVLTYSTHQASHAYAERVTSRVDHVRDSHDTKQRRVLAQAWGTWRVLVLVTLYN